MGKTGQRAQRKIQRYKTKNGQDQEPGENQNSEHKFKKLDSLGHVPTRVHVNGLETIQSTARVQADSQETIQHKQEFKRMA